MKRQITLTSESTEALRSLGQNIAYARSAREWSQEEAAKRTGMSRTTYRLLEQGSDSVAIGHYVSALNMYGVVDGIKHLCAPHLDEVGCRLRGLKGRHE